jgi:hypothetical protein
VSRFFQASIISVIELFRDQHCHQEQARVFRIIGGAIAVMDSSRRRFDSTSFERAGKTRGPAACAVISAANRAI